MEEASAFKTWFQPGPRPTRDAFFSSGWFSNPELTLGHRVEVVYWIHMLRSLDRLSSASVFVVWPRVFDYDSIVVDAFQGRTVVGLF